MDSNTLDTIHKQTVELLHEANDQITSAEDKFWYNGEFYSGSLNPEVLFVGYNPGYGRTDWPNRDQNKVFSDSYQLNAIKYIEGNEYKERLASQIYFMLQANFDNTDALLQDKAAETNLIYFNTPDIPIYNQSLKQLDTAMQERLTQHFIKSFESIIDSTHPKVILINGKTTFDQLKQSLNFSELEILETSESNSFICGKAVLDLSYPINVLVTTHLSWLKSDDALGSIGTFLKRMLEE